MSEGYTDGREMSFRLGQAEAAALEHVRTFMELAGLGSRAQTPEGVLRYALFVADAYVMTQRAFPVSKTPVRRIDVP